MILRGEIIEIVGRPSSGRTSLFVESLATVTRGGAVAALVDAGDTFDPASAARAGVDLSRLLWVRCGGHRRVGPRAGGLLGGGPRVAPVGVGLRGAPPPLPPPFPFRLRPPPPPPPTTVVIVAGPRLPGGGAAV